jgi:hypothetical protein
MRQMIHINESRVDIIHHLKAQMNISAYVCKLIEQDMRQEVLTREIVIDLIKQFGGSATVYSENDILQDLDACIEQGEN